MDLNQNLDVLWKGQCLLCINRGENRPPCAPWRGKAYCSMRASERSVGTTGAQMWVLSFLRHTELFENLVPAPQMLCSSADSSIAWEGALPRGRSKQSRTWRNYLLNWETQTPPTRECERPQDPPSPVLAARSEHSSRARCRLARLPL